MVLVLTLQRIVTFGIMSMLIILIIIDQKSWKKSKMTAQVLLHAICGLLGGHLKGEIQYEHYRVFVA